MAIAFRMAISQQHDFGGIQKPKLETITSTCPTDFPLRCFELLNLCQIELKIEPIQPRLIASEGPLFRTQVTSLVRLTVLKAGWHKCCEECHTFIAL